METSPSTSTASLIMGIPPPGIAKRLAGEASAILRKRMRPHLRSVGNSAGHAAGRRPEVDQSQTRLTALRERSVSLPSGSIEPHKLAVYLTAFDTLDSQTQSAYVAKVGYGHDYPAIAAAVGAPTPSDAQDLVGQAVMQLSGSVLGLSETNSTRLVELFEATALTPNHELADGDFEKKALRELVNIASVVAPHRQPDDVGRGDQNPPRAWGKTF